MADNDQVEMPDATTRRTLLRGALIAGVAAPLLAACSSNGGDSSDASGSAGGSGGGSSAGSEGSGGGGATALAETTAIPEGSGTIFGDQGVVVTQPKPGDFKGFTNICTHMSCPVSNVSGGTINCLCHGSQYSITDGSVVTGPATQPLAAKQLKVSGKEISLA